MKTAFLLAAFVFALCLLSGCMASADSQPEKSNDNSQSPTASAVFSAPADASDFYYIVDSNGRKGVVNGLGEVILPFDFSKIYRLEYNNAVIAFWAAPAKVTWGRMILRRQARCILLEEKSLQRIYIPQRMC